MALNNTDLENASYVTALKETVTTRIARGMWLRAAILGANDGLISTASLMLGIGAASSDKEAMIISGIAGALAGACSMAVGEFVSVSTQRDIEKSSIDKCVADVKLFNKLKQRLQEFHDTKAPKINVQAHVTEPTVKESESGDEAEARLSVLNKLNVQTQVLHPTVKELAESGLEATEARLTVFNKLNVRTHVTQPTVKESESGLEAEVRLTSLEDDKKELDALANPYKAAAASALSFLCGAFLPIVSTIAVSSSKIRFIIITVVTSISLVGFGGLGAFLGGSPVRVSAMRAVLGGWISMAISYGLLKAFDGGDKHFQV